MPSAAPPPRARAPVSPSFVCGNGLLCAPARAPSCFAPSLLSREWPCSGAPVLLASGLLVSMVKCTSCGCFTGRGRSSCCSAPRVAGAVDAGAEDASDDNDDSSEESRKGAPAPAVFGDSCRLLCGGARWAKGVVGVLALKCKGCPSTKRCRAKPLRVLLPPPPPPPPPPPRIVALPPLLPHTSSMRGSV